MIFDSKFRNIIRIEEYWILGLYSVCYSSRNLRIELEGPISCRQVSRWNAIDIIATRKEGRIKSQSYDKMQLIPFWILIQKHPNLKIHLIDPI